MHGLSFFGCANGGQDHVAAATSSSNSGSNATSTSTATSTSSTTTSMAAPAISAPPTERATTKRVYGDINDRLWHFQVRLEASLQRHEQLALVGSCAALGNWQHDKCVVMTRDEDDDSGYDGECGGESTQCWSADVHIPRDTATQYRYFVCALNADDERPPIVRRWETHLQPRMIDVWSEQQQQQPPAVDVFGWHDGVEKVERGWLTTETIVQLKFFNAPFKWHKPLKRGAHVLVKVTPVKLAPHNTTAAQLDDSLSCDTHDGATDHEEPYAFSEVTTLSDDDAVLRAQPQFGTFCGAEDLVIFHLTISELDNTGYLIDFYRSQSRVLDADSPTPVHLGYHYVLPHMLKRSEGLCVAPITCRKRHRPMGTMQFGYLIIRPTSCALDMRVSYARHWNKKWSGLDVGHRGSGGSFKVKDASLRENTITSLKYAAAHGADMVEFDVQLSKDLVPVIYHDFMIYVSLRKKRTLQEHDDFMELPMRQLSYEQLRILKVYHNEEHRTRETRAFHNDDTDEHQPFPQLAEALEVVDPHVGFNVEIKWSQRLRDGTMEADFEQTLVERNLYLDCILDVLLRKAGQRRIVLSCFDPDICTMLRFKQNRYPVMFLTIGISDKYQGYEDPRGNRMEVAVLHAHAMQLLGIVAHTEDLLRDPTQIELAQRRDLVLFCWGDDNNCKDNIRRMKSLGLHGVIYDKMDTLTSKVDKRSVFCVQAKHNVAQQELLKIQQLEMNGKVCAGGGGGGGGVITAADEYDNASS